MAPRWNTLSAIIRNAWDGKNLKTMTKNSPAKATEAHISIIGHITRNELLRYLDNTECGNGFANRFLWACVKRSKVLPEGGKVSEADMDCLAESIKEAVDFSRTIGEINVIARQRSFGRKFTPNFQKVKLGYWGLSQPELKHRLCVYRVFMRC